MLYTQASHSTLVWITERNKIDSWVVTVAVWIIFYVCIKNVLPKLQSNNPTSLYLIHSHLIASKFYE
jgi:hypothetical protein